MKKILTAFALSAASLCAVNAQAASYSYSFTGVISRGDRAVADSDVDGDQKARGIEGALFKVAPFPRRSRTAEFMSAGKCQLISSWIARRADQN
jgi:hypothetical protein